jgi:hypothetical protein
MDRMLETSSRRPAAREEDRLRKSPNLLLKIPNRASEVGERRRSASVAGASPVATTRERGYVGERRKKGEAANAVREKGAAHSEATCTNRRVQRLHRT